MTKITQAAIAADSPYTAEAGARIARQGGSAVDIAVAAALAAVSEPLMCSLGGSGFFMIHPAGQKAELIDGADATPTIDDREMQESAAWRSAHLSYGDGIDVKAGAASIAVPGVLAAAELAWKRHGRLPWREIVAPALELARGDFPASPTLTQWLNVGGKALFWQQAETRRCFFPDGQNVLRESEPIHIPDLDRTLEAIAEHGAGILYQGELAKEFADKIQQFGGFITREDMASYRAVVREPIAIESRGFQLALNPTPAVGGIAVGCLIKLLESNWRDSLTAPQRVALQAESQSALLTTRTQKLNREGLDDRAARSLLASFGMGDDFPSIQSPNTTHFSVVARDGSLVAVTMSMGYGAGVIVPGLGIACNNSLGEPELNPRGFLSSPPGVRIVSNMAPTVAWHPDGQCLALGSPGASRITTSIAQTWARFALEGMTFEDAVTAPRLHIESYHDGLRAQYEPGINGSLLPDKYLQRPFEAPNMYFGAIKLAGLDGNGRFHAVADQRRQGAVEIVEN